jgi:hypothetical protein
LIAREAPSSTQAAAFVLGSCRGEDAMTARMHQLDRGRADSTGTTVYQKVLAMLQRAVSNTLLQTVK